MKASRGENFRQVYPKQNPYQRSQSRQAGCPGKAPSPAGAFCFRRRGGNWDGLPLQRRQRRSLRAPCLRTRRSRPRRNRLRTQVPGHTVGGGGVKAVAGKKRRGVFSVTTAPSKNRAQRWAYRAQNSTSWLTITTHTPCCVSRCRIPAKVALNAASRPLVGSSNNRISGSRSRTATKAVLCCSPPDKS